MIYERIWAMPSRNTFSIPPIKKFVEEEIGDKTGKIWLDPFANSSKYGTVTNDLNTEYDTDYHLDALTFLKQFKENSVDGVIFDPPYSPNQVKEVYDGIGESITNECRSDYWSMVKDEISRVVKDAGKVLCFGWNSGGIGKKNGFDMYRVLLVPHGGWHNDTICTAEKKCSTLRDLFDVSP